MSIKKKDAKRRQSPRRVLSNNLFLLKMVWRHAPGLIVMALLNGVLFGTSSSITTLFTKIIFDRLGSGAETALILRPVIILAVYEIIFAVFAQWYWNYYSAKLNYTLNYKINAELFVKARTLDLACYDDPDFYNDFVWAMNEATGRTTETVSDINSLISSVIGSAATVAILFSIDKWLALTILAFTVMRWFAQRLSFKLYHSRREALNPLERRRDYYSRVFYMSEYTKELRMTDVADTVLEDYDANSDSIKRTFKIFGHKIAIARMLSWGLGILCDAAVMLLLTYELMVTHNIALGGFTASINATWRLSWMVRSLTNTLIKFPEHSLYTEKVRTFTETEPKIRPGGEPVPEFEELRLRGVDFAYAPVVPKEGAQPPPEVLSDVDIEIKRGEKIAFVGYNGAGKTTLIKLIMRLYDPAAGVIEYNGRDIREYDLAQYRAKIGALFQDYKIFAATLAENVLGDDYDEGKREAVLAALEHADFGEKLADMPRDIMTALTREYDEQGVNLSGGEAQKVAIARVFANPHDILILDEPSSALDPDAEYRLNRSIAEYAADKTVIFISHRLSTTRMADRIYMFDGGRVVESGTHEELMAKGGKYAYMFNLQAQKYL